jgi:CRISPR-associated exonuclease Cas4
MIGLWLLWLAGRRHEASGLPHGRVVYIDTGHLTRLERTLYDPGLDLSGRPDYIVERLDELVPVEVKSGRAPADPYQSHIMQLTAYCKLIQTVYGRRPSYGIIKYADQAFAVDFTSRAENDLVALITEMRQTNRLAPDRSHGSAGRCQACGYLHVCDEALE